VLEKYAIKARDYDEYIRTLRADIPAAAAVTARDGSRAIVTRRVRSGWGA
jgi:hypothetical protein